MNFGGSKHSQSTTPKIGTNSKGTTPSSKINNIDSKQLLERAESSSRSNTPVRVVNQNNPGGILGNKF